MRPSAGHRRTERDPHGNRQGRPDALPRRRGGCVVSLNETEITALCERFRVRAETFRCEAVASARSGDIVRLTAMASTLEWAARELYFSAGISLPTRALDRRRANRPGATRGRHRVVAV